MQYLYSDGEDHVFMDASTYDQVTIAAEIVGEGAGFLKDTLTCTVLFFNDRPVGVTLPNFVEVEVVETEPGARGDTTAGNVTKPAKVETGAEVRVPLFVNEGERVKVDTRTGHYVERVKG